MFNEREWATNDHLAAFGWLKLSKAYSPVNSVLRFFAVPSRGASSSSSNLDNRETSFSLNFIVQPGLIPMGTDTKKKTKNNMPEEQAEHSDILTMLKILKPRKTKIISLV